jgi:hypothetical protein
MLSDDLTRREFIQKASLSLPGVLTTASGLMILQGCGSASVQIFIRTALEALSAGLSILKFLGIEASFKDSVNYQEASQCKHNFEIDESDMKQHGMKIFIGVQRSPFNLDTAIVLSGQDTTIKNRSIASFQFQGKDSVKLHNNEVSAINEAARFIRDQYRFSKREIATAIAITKKEKIIEKDKVTGKFAEVTRFSDARGGHFLFDPLPKGELSQFTAGVIRIYQPDYNTLDNMPIIGLRG